MKILPILHISTFFEYLLQVKISGAAYVMVPLQIKQERNEFVTKAFRGSLMRAKDFAEGEICNFNIGLGWITVDKYILRLKISMSNSIAMKIEYCRTQWTYDSNCFLLTYFVSCSFNIRAEIFSQKFQNCLSNKSIHTKQLTNVDVVVIFKDIKQSYNMRMLA